MKIARWRLAILQTPSAISSDAPQTTAALLIGSNSESFGSKLHATSNTKPCSNAGLFFAEPAPKNLATEIQAHSGRDKNPSPTRVGQMAIAALKGDQTLAALTQQFMELTDSAISVMPFTTQEAAPKWQYCSDSNPRPFVTLAPFVTFASPCICRLFGSVSCNE